MNYKQLFTPPNLISLSRLPFAIATIITLYTPLSLLFFSLVVIADVLDGFVARKFNMVSEIGSLLDPIMDKIANGLIFFGLFYTTGLLWWYIPLFFLRDICISIGALWIYFILNNDLLGLKASNMGKLTTGTQFITIISMLLTTLIKDYEVQTTLYSYISYMILATAGLSLITILDYIYGEPQHQLIHFNSRNIK